MVKVVSVWNAARESGRTSGLKIDLSDLRMIYSLLEPKAQKQADSHTH